MTRKEQLLLALVAASIVLGSGALYFRGREAEISHRVPVTAALDAPPPGPLAPPPRPSPIPQSLDITEELASAPSPPPVSRISVAASGAVKHPGVYELEEGSRVEDLLKSAGGCLDTADLTDINRAARLLDGTTLTIPVQGTTVAEGTTLVLRAAPSAAELNPACYTLSGWSQRPSPLTPAEAPAASAPAAPTEKPSGLVNINTADASALEGLPGIGPKLAQEIIRYRAASPFSSVDDLENVPGIGPKKLESIRALVSVQ